MTRTAVGSFLSILFLATPETLAMDGESRRKATQRDRIGAIHVPMGPCRFLPKPTEV